MKTQDQSLKSQLEAKAKDFAEKADQATQSTMQGATEALFKSGIVSSVPKQGDKAPDFSLMDSQGQQFKLSDEIHNSMVILSFYRGSWCPYCNIQLRELQKRLEDFEAAGAKLITISPEKPDDTAKLMSDSGFEFRGLFDQGNKVARQFKLVFKLPDNLIEVYKSFGIDLVKANGDDSWELPLAATFVIDENMLIKYAFVDVDYKKRAEPDDILLALKS